MSSPRRLATTHAAAVVAVLGAALASGCAARLTPSRASAAAASLLAGALGAAAVLAALRGPLRGVAASEERVRAVIEAQPMACVLFAESGRIAFANSGARELFFGGADVDGRNFLAMLADAPELLRLALTGESDGLFTVEAPSGPETFHIARCALDVGGEAHMLLTVKNLTRELSRQEAASWKKAIRVMSHEVNNTLAPMSSLMHSARYLTRGADLEARLAPVFDTVDERVQHLTGFLDAYASLAKLAPPRKIRAPWSRLLEPVSRLYPSVRIAPPPESDGLFDPAQLEQVVINLLKNAQESGGPPDEIELAIIPLDGGYRLAVSDRGKGLSAEAAGSALLPFYTTKEAGSGLGLAICREIVEAHGGSIRLEAREGGGATASVWLPAPSAAPRSSPLTISRA